MAGLRKLLKLLLGRNRLTPHTPTISLKSPIGIIMVGAGMIAHKHMDALKKIRGVEIKSVCAAHLDSASQAARQYGIESFYEGYKEALSIPIKGIEVVLIATPPHTHHEIAIAAINSGRHVLVEKPAGVNPKQVKEIASAADKRGLLAGSFGSRFALSPASNALEDIIKSGQLGRIYRIEIRSRTRKQRYGIEFNPRARWALSKACGGGVLLDWGVYALAWLDSVINMPRLKCIAGQIQYGLAPSDLPKDVVYDVEDAVFGLFRAEDGSLLNLDLAWVEHLPAQRQALIIGTKGGAEIRWVPNFYVKLFIINKAGRPEIRPIPLPYKEYNAELAVIEDFLKAVDNQHNPALPLHREAELMDMLMECLNLA